MNVEKLKRDRASVIAEMKSIQATVDSRSDNTITADEKAKFNELRSKVESIDESISRQEYLAKQEADLALRADPVATQERAKSFGEFICRFINDPSAPRFSSRDTVMGVPNQAGYFVPPEFDSVIRAVKPSEAIVRPRATVIAGGNSPDATFKINVFDQGGENGVYGGVTLNWSGETQTRQVAGDIRLNEIEFTPQPLIGFIDISKQLLDNSSAAGQFAETQMRLAGIAKEEKAFLSGSGVLQPTGFINHPCNATVTRQTSGKISYDDVVQMVATATESSGSDYVFIASKTSLPQLTAIKDSAGNLIWQWSAVTGTPNTLHGLPILFSERVPVVGNAGDLVLADLSKYIIRDGSGMNLFLDPYTRAINGMTRMYFSWNVDAKPWLTSPIKGEDGVARSPFVTLV
jgi:HK97 family phage major capsid protein